MSKTSSMLSCHLQSVRSSQGHHYCGRQVVTITVETYQTNMSACYSQPFFNASLKMYSQSTISLYFWRITEWARYFCEIEFKSWDVGSNPIMMAVEDEHLYSDILCLTMNILFLGRLQMGHLWHMIIFQPCKSFTISYSAMIQNITKSTKSNNNNNNFFQFLCPIIFYQAWQVEKNERIILFFHKSKLIIKDCVLISSTLILLLCFHLSS